MIWITSRWLLLFIYYFHFTLTIFTLLLIIITWNLLGNFQFFLRANRSQFFFSCLRFMLLFCLDNISRFWYSPFCNITCCPDPFSFASTTYNLDLNFLLVFEINCVLFIISYAWISAKTIAMPWLLLVPFFHLSPLDLVSKKGFCHQKKIFFFEAKFQLELLFDRPYSFSVGLHNTSTSSRRSWYYIKENLQDFYHAHFFGLSSGKKKKSIELKIIQSCLISL